MVASSQPGGLGTSVDVCWPCENLQSFVINLPAFLTSSVVPCPPVCRGFVQSKILHRFPLLLWLEKQEQTLKISSSALPRIIYNVFLINFGVYYFYVTSGVTVERVIGQWGVFYFLYAHRSCSHVYLQLVRDVPMPNSCCFLDTTSVTCCLYS